MLAPGVRAEAIALLRYMARGSAFMTDTSLVRARFLAWSTGRRHSGVRREPHPA